VACDEGKSRLWDECDIDSEVGPWLKWLLPLTMHNAYRTDPYTWLLREAKTLTHGLPKVQDFLQQNKNYI
jgi:hypothetical protein